MEIKNLSLSLLLFPQKNPSTSTTTKKTAPSDDPQKSPTDPAKPESYKKRPLQKVDILKIAEPSPLIDPSQVVITQGKIYTADPVMTPIGITSEIDL